MKYLSFILLIFTLSSCNLHKKCDEAFDEARAFYRDTALMYLWRCPDSDIYRDEYGQVDSGLVAYKSDGTFDYAGEQKDLNFNNMWYVKDSIIYSVICRDMSPMERARCKYSMKNDTLFLFAVIDNNIHNISDKPQIHIKVKKYK